MYAYILSNILLPDHPVQDALALPHLNINGIDLLSPYRNLGPEYPRSLPIPPFGILVEQFVEITKRGIQKSF